MRIAPAEAMNCRQAGRQAKPPYILSFRLLFPRIFYLLGRFWAAQLFFCVCWDMQRRIACSVRQA